jgi:hypothetical protein
VPFACLYTNPEPDIDLSSVWPIGSVFTSTLSTNPAVLLGFGTWSAFGAGRVLVGLDASDPSFDVALETGGSKTSTPTGTVSQPTFTGTANIASSAVSAGTPAGTINAHTTAADSTTTGGTAKVTGPGTHTFTGSALGTHQHTLTPAGTVSQPSFTGAAQSVLPPYIVVFFFTRTS